MSTQVTPAVSRLFPAQGAPRRPEPARQSSRVRAATVRRRLLLATDALAVADLLLGINFSIGSVGAPDADGPDGESSP